MQIIVHFKSLKPICKNINQQIKKVKIVRIHCRENFKTMQTFYGF